MPPPEDHLFELIASGLETKGYVCLPAALPEDIAEGLVDQLAQIESREFHKAATGRGNDRTRNQFVRRDRIHWIEESGGEASADRPCVEACRSLKT